LFDTTNFPNSSTANRSDAALMYAMLVGRVSSITRSVTLDEDTLNYAHTGSVDRNRQREMALYVQDSYKVRPRLTLNYGVRWDVQFPVVNVNGTYTRVGIEGVYGISGVGNLFRPTNNPPGQVPVFTPVEPGQAAYNTQAKQFSPSFGLAWSLPNTQVPVLSWLIGKQGHSVFRAGYSIATVREGMQIPISIWGANQGRNYSLTIDPANYPAEFGPPGSVLFRDPSLPARAEPNAPAYPLPVLSGNSVNDFDPNLRQGYVQSWNLSFQRELTRSTVLDVRYVGNHAVGLWRQVNLNEVNIFENGFLDEFKVARQNLAIANGISVAQLALTPNSALRTTNFANQGLPGQGAVPILTTALGATNLSDSTSAANLQRGEAGTLANAIATNATRMTNLRNAGYPANMFRVNPTTGNGGAFLVINGGGSTYDALQLELRRRLSNGLLVQGSYTWSKALSNMLASSSAVSSQPTTFRSPGNDKGPSPWDIRHGFKLNYVYELPFGRGRALLSGAGNRIVRKAVEGWQISGVARMQSGSPDLITGRNTFNNVDGGVVLRNLTTKQLQDMISIRKTTSPTSGFGVIYFLPQDLVANSQAAWESGGRTLAQLDLSKPYIGPQTEPGQLGYRVFMYGPWQSRWDVSLAKQTRIGEHKTLEIRAQALNVANATNFLLGAAGNEVNSGAVGSTFGQTTSAYRDITVSGSSDPGSRMIEFLVRFRF